MLSLILVCDVSPIFMEMVSRHSGTDSLGGHLACVLDETASADME